MCERVPLSDAVVAQKASVFISYARKDKKFAYEIEATLTKYGFDVLIDRTGIAKAEDFEKRIVGMILDADVVVFIISPRSVLSRYCKWEVELTESLRKRLIPIVWERVCAASPDPIATAASIVIQPRVMYSKRKACWINVGRSAGSSSRAARLMALPTTIANAD
jgi:TIR domain